MPPQDKKTSLQSSPIAAAATSAPLDFNHIEGHQQHDVPTMSAGPKPGIIDRLWGALKEGIPAFNDKFQTSDVQEAYEEGRAHATGTPQRPTPPSPKMQLITPETAMTPAEQKAHPILTGLGEAAGSLTSPESVAMIAGTGGFGEMPGVAGKLIPKLISLGFSASSLKGAYDQLPDFKKAMDAGNESEAERILTHIVADTAMGAYAGQHGTEGAGEHLKETGKQFYQGLKDEGRAAIQAKAPQASAEAGKVPLGGKKPNFDAIPGHATVEAPTSPHERLPEGEYVYHATDKSRADAIRQSGLRPKSWYAHTPEDALKSGAVPISGNRADLRVFAVPKSEISATAPDVADMGAREVEKGRFVMSQNGHQPIEVDHGGRPFEPVETGDTSFNFGANEKPGNPQVAESAQRYNASRGQGNINHEPVALPAAEEKSSLADAYDAAKHEPDNPKVQASYKAMKNETLAQFNHAKNDLGITFDFTNTDPYKNAGDMQADLRNNHHLSVFTGGEVPKDHPLSEVEPTTGQSYNNIFRATHDVFGHAAGGHDFSEGGEHSAYGAHKQMYSAEAQPAVRTETQGQSNWYFNNREVRNGKTPDTFPEQKATILPDSGKEDTTVPKGTREEYQSAAEKSGVEFRGVQKGLEGAHPGLAIFQDPQSGTSVAVRLNEWSPEKLQEHIDAARERMAGTAPVSANADIQESQRTPTSGYHPDLQKVVDKYGVSEHPVGVRRGASFIAPDGKFVHLEGTEHPTAIEAATGERPTEDKEALGTKINEDNKEQDSRIRFLNDTGTIRTRFSKDRAGETLHVSVPKQGVTPEQVQALKDAVASSMPKGYGNIVLERSDISSETKNELSKTQEMVKSHQIDQLLKDIHAHPQGDWARTASDEMFKSPAGAIDPKTGKMDHGGFGVEIFPEARAAREPLDHKPTEQDVRDFHAEHKDIFDKHPELRVGWDMG